MLTMLLNGLFISPKAPTETEIGLPGIRCCTNELGTARGIIQHSKRNSAQQAFLEQSRGFQIVLAHSINRSHSS